MWVVGLKVKEMEEVGREYEKWRNVLGKSPGGQKDASEVDRFDMQLQYFFGDFGRYSAVLP